MAGMVVNAELLRNQIGHALTGPERCFVTQFFGTAEQSACQSLAFSGIQQWLASSTARLHQRFLAACFIFLPPPAHRLVGNTQLTPNLAVVQSLAQQR